MIELTSAIPALRNSAVAVLRIHRKRLPVTGRGKPRPAEFELSIASGFCIRDDRYVLTAFHIFSSGQPRIAEDKFYVFTVPGNGETAYHFPVLAFPFERPESDVAVLEIGPCATDGIHISAIPVSFAPRNDGAQVVTVGFPSPEIHGATIDPQGNYGGGQFFLKSHANEGVISAQYALGGVHVYEFNVGWHHGESGGLIASTEGPLAAFSVMQQYRVVQTPNGKVAGPHRGVALSAVKSELLELGVAAV